MAKQNKTVSTTLQSSPAVLLPGDMFDRALQLAIEAHRGQTDKYHQPYMLHVLGVMGRCRTIEEKIVALLHDVVEDTDHSFDDLRELGISERIITAVELLTRRPRETYDHFVERIAPDPLARAVKLADLEDNMDVRRSTRAMKEKDAERMEKYRTAWQKLAGLHVASTVVEAMKPKVSSKRAKKQA